MSDRTDAILRRTLEILGRIPVIRWLVAVVLIAVAFVAAGIEQRRARRLTLGWASVLLDACCAQHVPSEARTETGFECRAADLAECRPVADVVAEGPELFAAPHAVDCATGRPVTTTWAELLDAISLGVQVQPDGMLQWWVAFGDEAFAVTNVDVDVLGEELVEAALAAQPGVVAAEHLDREVYEIVMSEPVRADVFLARYLSAVVIAYRTAYPRLER